MPHLVRPELGQTNHCIFFVSLAHLYIYIAFIFCEPPLVATRLCMFVGVGIN
jgi:hypothetical protein